MKILILWPALLAPLLAEDWTVNGKDYHNVKVGQVEADRVHITYDGGAGTIALTDLPPDMQKRFNYDPATANAAICQRETEQNLERARLIKEMDQQSDQTPKEEPTFSEKVESLKLSRREQLEKELKACQGFLEDTKIDEAASASDPYRMANLKTYENYLQSVISSDRAKLSKLDAVSDN